MAKKARQVLTPQAARTRKALCALPRDHVTSGDYWVMVDETMISLAAQKMGESATGIVLLPRGTFEKFVRWYQTGRMR